MERFTTGGSQAILAHVDPVTSGVVSGWAVLESDPETPLKIVYTTPEGEGLEVLCDRARTDAQDVNPDFAMSGFQFELPEPPNPRISSIELRIDEHDVILIAPIAPRRRFKPAVDPSCDAIGEIDTIDSRRIEGWLYSPDPEAIPVIRVGGRFATPSELKRARPDVNRALGVPGDMGFVFTPPGFGPSDEVELLVLTVHGLGLVRRSPARSAKIEENFFAQLNAAAKIAADPESVGIVCWDGAHNPIGRAKVLHDVVATQRPAVLLSYLSENFGERIWPPLQGVDIPVVTIPWSTRRAYHRAIAEAGIQFDTVWLCKPRYPTFLLAKAVSRPDSRLVLDYDDNEEHFSRSATSRDKAYGLPTLNLARNLSERIPARTAASVTLQKEFNAHMVRHARSAAADLPESIKDGPVRVCFIGTVRPHKNALKAARAIRLFALTTGIAVEYHVRGDVQPTSLIKELQETGAVVGGNVAMSDLQSEIAEMDVVLTGYPSLNDEAITAYQISSKIGDALSVGKPVLVPDGPSVSDLRDIPGIFLFDESNFDQALKAAMACKANLQLPKEFTLEGAYRAFAAAEKQAGLTPRAGEVLDELPNDELAGRDAQGTPTLLLIWKQPDAGFYGRRVDQVARAYKRKNPQSRVIILELVHRTKLDQLKSNALNFASDNGRLLDAAAIKQSQGLEDDGVVIKQVPYESSAVLGTHFDEFLLQNGLTPANTTVVVYPLIQFFDKIFETLQSFPLIVDVVDNQLSWSGKDPLQTRFLQYALLFGAADAVLFNSQVNQTFFRERGILPANAKAKVIPNWYMLPASRQDKPASRGPGRQLLYSGNMNDRIDWQLFRKLAEMDDDVQLHLVGAVNVANPDFLSLLEEPNVSYHGPLTERETLPLLHRMDVAVMPHKVDDISTYMNPLKVHMYSAVGLPAVATAVPGIMPSPMLWVADGHDQFLQLTKIIADGGLRAPSKPRSPESGDAYVQLIDSLRGEPASVASNGPTVATPRPRSKSRKARAALG